MAKSNVDIHGLISQYQTEEKFRDLTWRGTFGDYVNLIKDHPEITRTAFQRVYDMIMGYGSTEYVEFKKKVTHYKFFDDETNDGKDAIYGLDIALMKLVNAFRSAAEGYGTERRVILLHGPVGSSKSTIARLLKHGLEAYSKTEEGSLYTFSWTDKGPEKHGLLGKGIEEFACPMHEEPLHLVPLEIRDKIVDDLNRGTKSKHKIKIDGDLCPACRYISRHLLTK